VLHFHFAPDCVVEKCGPRTVRATRNEGWIEFTLPHFVKIDLVRGATDPILGWCSDAYHQRRPITTLRVVHDITGEIVFDTTVQISATDSDS